MDWFLLALIPPALWSVTNHFDKYLLSKYFKGGGVGALMIFSSIVGVVLLPFIALIDASVLQLSESSIWMALNGFFFLLAVLPYFYALSKDDASVAVPLFQVIPVFSYILGFIFLNETLLPGQILGGIIVVLGAILMSLDFPQGKKFKLKKDVFFLMMLSSTLFAINFVFFKRFAIETNFLYTSFWEYVGFAIFAVLLFLFIKPYRHQFLKVLVENKKQVLALNGLNELVNIVAKIAFNIVSLSMPITLAWIVNGFQPFFVFLYGVLLTIFFPKVSQENISRRVVIQKIFAIVVMFIGTSFLG